MICSNPNHGELSSREVDQNLRLLTFEGGAYSLMVGMGETYLGALVIAVGLGEYLAGLITTVPVLIGAILQLVSFWGVRLFNSNKNWAAFAAATQAVSASLIAAMVWQDQVTASLLIFVAGWYWFGSLAAGPAWNAWVQNVVPTESRAQYFGIRARVCQCLMLIGLLVAGMLLRTFSGVGVFVVLFALAALCRACSAIAIGFGTERPSWRPNATATSNSFLENLRSLDATSTKLIAYLFSMQAAVYVSAPYFTPYMLSHLKLSYIEYTWLIGLGFGGKILAMTWAGRVAARVGTNRILLIGGLGIIPLAVAWVFVKSVIALSVVQIAGGILWAFYELAILLLFFERFAHDQRVAALSIYNLGNAASMVVGSLAGGALLAAFGGELIGYYCVFAVSSGGRLLSFLLMPTERATERPSFIPHFRFTAIRPIVGAWVTPIFARSRAVVQVPEREPVRASETNAGHASVALDCEPAAANLQASLS
ncbi:MAG: MFS transporter [Planctomycetales bacterium]|nr:MFS transporter [Planctomycetales bacterium]